MPPCLQKRDNGTRVMYHATSRANARSIIRSQQMVCGSSGMLGPGIYFSMNADAASRKRRGGNGGGDDEEVILSAVVDLGTTGFFRDGDYLDEDELWEHGVDSAKVSVPRRDVFAVFDSGKVSCIAVHSGSIEEDDEEYGGGYPAKRRRY